MLRVVDLRPKLKLGGLFALAHPKSDFAEAIARSKRGERSARALCPLSTDT